jgi:hypothetical protein
MVVERLFFACHDAVVVHAGAIIGAMDAPMKAFWLRPPGQPPHACLCAAPSAADLLHHLRREQPLGLVNVEAGWIVEATEAELDDPTIGGLVDGDTVREIIETVCDETCVVYQLAGDA